MSLLHTLFDIHPSTIFPFTQLVFITIATSFIGSFILEFMRTHLKNSSAKKVLRVFPPLMRGLAFAGLIFIVSRIAGIPVLAMPILLVILPTIFLYFLVRALFLYNKIESKKVSFSDTNEYLSTKQKYLSKKKKK